MRRAVVNLLIDYAPDHPYHRATITALEHAAAQAEIPTEVRVVRTSAIGDGDSLTRPGSALFVGPGTPYEEPQAVDRVIREARERGTPLVAT